MPLLTSTDLTYRFFFFIFCIFQTIQNKYNSNPAQFSTLQLIVYEDIENGVAGNDGSAAMAVLWLKRYMYKKGIKTGLDS